jgi:hypothetical protein
MKAVLEAAYKKAINDTVAKDAASNAEDVAVEDEAPVANPAVPEATQATTSQPAPPEMPNVPPIEQPNYGTRRCVLHVFHLYVLIVDINLYFLVSVKHPRLPGSLGSCLFCMLCVPQVIVCPC